MQRTNRGFSLIELLIVVAIIMVISAMALPTIMNALDDYKLRTAAGGYANFVRDVRMQSIRDNRSYVALPTWNPSTGMVEGWYSERNNPPNWQYDAGEPFYPLPRNVWLWWGNPMGIPPVPTNFPPTWSLLSFTPRGVPCDFNWWGGGACTVNTGTVYYLWQQRAMGQNGWAAVTISPAGRVKTWVWDGNSWESN